MLITVSPVGSYTHSLKMRLKLRCDTAIIRNSAQLCRDKRVDKTSLAIYILR